MYTDLFGAPIATPPIRDDRKPPSVVDPEKQAKKLDAKRQRYAHGLEQNPTALLFQDLLNFLRAPVIKMAALPAEFRSDRSGVKLDYDSEEEESGADILPDIPYTPWGTAWVTDRNGQQWSAEGVRHTQVLLFWESMEEMALSNNAREKWSVLKWVFMPAIRKSYVWDNRLGRSHCLVTHERDETFSFRNCCIAARMEEEAIRDGFRRNIRPEVLKEVLKVCRFD